jgi:hypothetical protein
MANSNSTVYATQIAPNIGDRLAVRSVNAKTFFADIAYTMLGTEAQGDTLNLVKLPQGAVIDPTLSSVVGDGIATTATLDIGDNDTLGVGAAADADRYADGLDVAAAGIDLFSANACAARLVPYALGDDAIIICEFKTLVTPVAAKKLLFRIAYRMEG